MHSNPALFDRRIDRFLTERIAPAVYRSAVPLTVRAWDVPDEPVPFAEAVSQHYAEVSPGHRWGPAWGTTWFHVRGDIPAGWVDGGADAAGTAVEVVADLGFSGVQPGFQAEGMAWTPTGEIIKAVSPYNDAVPWRDLGSGQVELYLEAAANPDVMGGRTFAPTPLGRWGTAGDAPLYTLGAITVALRDTTVWELQQDLIVLIGLMRELPADSTRRARISHTVETMLDTVDPHDVAGTAEAGRAVLRPALEAPANVSAHRVTAVGHAHIDSAWLWPTRETIRKCARTFANVLHLMDDNPDLVFACSSAQQYAWVQESYPALFERIRAKVADGQFVPVGSMWVEADTNMPGGEAMARQLVAGKRFFAEELGVETNDVWLPDSFGYTGALPQLIRLAGCEWFLSQKLSWNETNTMPHHTFAWEGIDGSRVLAHFPPVDTYNSRLSAAELAHAERSFAEKGVASGSIVPFGWGDGGGGPTRDMIAAARRFSDLEGSPRVELGSPNDFFARTEAELVDPPVWSGEMYLEFHRGTYTSQARTKAGNRRSEHLLREAELWATTAAVRADVAYPYDELEQQWRTVLLNQFHDILPGSSIGWVHDQAEQAHAAVAERLEALIEESVAAVVGPGDVPLVLNAAPHERDGVPALGIGPESDPGAQPVVLTRGADGKVRLGNGLVDVHLTADGQFERLVDLRNGRDVVPAGMLANVLQLHRDTPKQWDAWDVDVEYRRVAADLLEATSLEVVREDPHAATVEVVRDVGASHLVQRITVSAGSAAIEIVTEVDWHEQQKLLKLAFPLDVHADRSAAETQFGHVFRPTHANTSWDAAKFEICAHRWVHVGEPGYGVAISNATSYGHDISRGQGADGGTVTTVRQSLVRAPLFPDPVADQGRHRFTTVLHPGAGIADAVADGYRTNLPRRVVTGGQAVAPLVTVSHPAVVVEAAKLAEDRSGDVVVRLYESLGSRASATVTFDFGVAAVTPVDLLERELPTPGVRVSGDRATHAADAVRVRAAGAAGAGAGSTAVAVVLRPFQILTLRMVRG